MPISLPPVTPEIRSLFPAIAGNPDIIHADNAATTQMPVSVLAAIRNYYETHAANPGRGAYEWAQDAQNIVLETRLAISKLINLPDRNGIIFTSGTTMGLNMVAQCWGKYCLERGDEILLCLSDHHSMVFPWQKLAEEKELVIRPYRLRANGSIDLDDLASHATEKTKICCVTHINNIAGWLNDLSAIRSLLPENVIFNVDAAQSISHATINMQSCGIDFLSFSGHKMFAMTGVGVLGVSSRMHSLMRPLLYGGGMGEARQGSPLYERIEAGTLNMAGIISLDAACEFLADIKKYDLLPSLSRTLYERLLANPRLDLIFEQKTYALDHLCGIATFTIEGKDSGEVSDILSAYGINVRAGRHCSGASDSVRISLQIYNTEQEIHKLCDILEEISQK